MADNRYETIASEEITFGKNSFIEIARKEITIEASGKRLEFIAVSRGYYLPDGTRKWKASITLPDKKADRGKIAELIRRI